MCTLHQALRKPTPPDAALHSTHSPPPNPSHASGAGWHSRTAATWAHCALSPAPLLSLAPSSTHKTTPPHRRTSSSRQAAPTNNRFNSPAQQHPGARRPTDQSGGEMPTLQPAAAASLCMDSTRTDINHAATAGHKDAITACRLHPTATCCNPPTANLLLLHATRQTSPQAAVLIAGAHSSAATDACKNHEEKRGGQQQGPEPAPTASVDRAAAWWNGPPPQQLALAIKLP